MRFFSATTRRLISVVVTTSFLIAGTSAWAQVFGNPAATTVQLPTFGVSFDAEGLLQVKTFDDPTGRLIAQRIAAARQGFQGDLGLAVESRKISLKRLNAELQQIIRTGQTPSEAMRNLAGLTRITHAYCLPESQDIVLAGPAEPWVRNLADISIGIRSGRPTLQLEDLAVALRSYRSDKQNAFVGCTINPQPEGLRRLQNFQKHIPKMVSNNRRNLVAQWVDKGVRDSLGMAKVRVFGVSSKTHFARVMIEADYRMKRIAIGVELPPVPITTFAQALTTARHGALERWWFTPDYEGVIIAPDGSAMELVGQGVQLQTENKEVLPNGSIIDAGNPPTRATRAYASSFTKNYDRIAGKSPVFAQLRQLTDMLIVSAYVAKQDWYERASCTPTALLDEKSFSVNTHPTPEDAAVVVNTFWKGQRMFSPAGGGVSIEAHRAFEVAKQESRLVVQRRSLESHDEAKSWWWD